MILYDMASPIDWFYEESQTFDEMKSDPLHYILTQVPCVLYDNGNGKVYRFETLEELGMKWGVLVGQDPQHAFGEIKRKMDGSYIYPDNVLPSLVMRANFDDSEAFGFKALYPEWQSGTSYKKDWIIRYKDDIYRVGQDHTSQENWLPGADGTASLYSKIEITKDNYEVWKEYDGISGTYSNGQIVEDPNDGRLYKSKIDSNVWGPPSEQPNYWELYIK